MTRSSNQLNLHGVFTPVVTPFTADGSSVDKKSLERLVEEQLDAKVAGIVACGTTGEAVTLSDAEYLEVVSFVRQVTKGRVPCVAGISQSSTAQAVAVAKAVQELGCDGLLVASPPYNKPSQAGLIAHYSAIHAAVGLPIIGYNVPGRAGVSIAPATLGALSRQGIMMGLKDASGSVDSLADTMIAVDSSCQVVAGDDSLTLAVLAYGGVGGISASANVMPREFVKLIDSFRAGDTAAATREQLAMLPRIRALFIESNPVPAKAVLAMQGVIAHPTVRLPLAPLTQQSVAVVREAFGL
jgi:4-hydroxy-tetrahydrodipicolinate synthase